MKKALSVFLSLVMLLSLLPMSVLAADTAVTILEQPTDQRVLLGETAVFSVSAEGENLSYQWYYRTSADGDWTPVSKNGTSSTYSLATKERHNGYQYYCAVSGDGGAVGSDIATLTVLTEPESQYAASGQCGDNLTWTLDADGVLTISGAGDMWDFTNGQPWGQYLDSITDVVIEEGVTSIGSYAFTNTLGPESASSAGDLIVLTNTVLLTVTVPESVTTISRSVFLGCNSLTDIYFGGCERTWRSIAANSGADRLTWVTFHFAKENSPAQTIASGTCGDSLTWTLDEDGLLTVSGTGAMQNFGWNDRPWEQYLGSITAVVLETGVTSVGQNAFDSARKLTRVTLPEGLLSIGSSAFNMADLRTVVLPASLTELGSMGLGNNRNLQSVQVAEGSQCFRSENGVLFSADMTQLIYYPAGRIEDYTIPSTVTRIGPFAFAWSMVTGVTFPEGAAVCEGSAFWNCAGLRSVSLPASLTYLGSGNFGACWGIASFTVAADNPNYSSRNGVLYNKTGTMLIMYPPAKNETAVTVPDGVEGIGVQAFFMYRTMTSLTLPASLTQIDGSAFSGCSSLADIYYGGSSVDWSSVSVANGNDPILNATMHYGEEPESIGGDCGDNLTWSLSWSENGKAVLTISGAGDMWDFPSGQPWGQYLTVIAEVVIEEGVTGIGSYAFSRNTGVESATPGELIVYTNAVLQSVSIPSTVTRIGRGAFQSCNALTSLYFGGCQRDLRRMSQGSGLEYLTSVTYAFGQENGPAETVASGTCGNALAWTLDEDGILNISGTGAMWDFTVSTIPWDAYLESITSVVLGSGVTSVGNNAFRGCSFLTSVTPPQGLTRLGNYAFYNCTRLQSISLPEGLTSIGNEAFYLTAFTTVTLPASVTQLGWAAITGMNSLTEIHVAADNPAFCSVEGVLFSKDMTRLLAYPVGSSRTTYAIPVGVTYVGPYAFRTSGLRSITIPEGIQQLDTGAIWNCYMLSSVSLPASLTSIADGNFNYCWNVNAYTVAAGNPNYRSEDGVLYSKDGTVLIMYPVASTRKTFAVPEGVSVISGTVFYSARSLESITLPSTLTFIGGYSFYNCSALTDVYYSGTEASWNSLNIADNPSLLTAVIHFSSLDIVTQPEDQKVLAGKTAVFEVDARGEGTLSYQWYYRTSEAGEWTKVSVNGKSAAYSLTAKLRHNGYQYRCEVTNGTDTVYSQVASLQVVEALEILASGVCGDALTWSLDEDGVLTVSGTGDMWDFTLDDAAPWAEYRSQIVKAVVEAGVTSLGSEALRDCKYLTKVSLPEGLLSIGAYAFMECGGLKALTLPESLSAMGAGALNYTSIESLYLPASLVSLDDEAVNLIGGLTEIRVAADNPAYCSVEGVLFNKNMTELIAYPNCRSGSAYNIPAGVVRVGHCAFCWSQLQSIGIPEGVTELAAYALFNCYALRDVVLPASLTSIGNGNFQWGNALSFSVAEENLYFSSQDGVLYNKEGTILYFYPAGSTARAFTVPDGVETIWTDAFSNAKNLYSVTLPESLIEIGYAAFSSATNLTDVYYCGGESEWEQVTLGWANDGLTQANLHFLKTLTITLQPKDQRVKAGETATFSVEAEGEGTLSYQWYYRTSEDGEWTKVTKNGTEAVYSLVTKERHNGYQYRCAVSDGTDTAYSKVAKLRVNEEAEVVASGDCGDSLTWTLDEDGLLVVSGTGDMWDFTDGAWDDQTDTRPWGEWASEIVTLIVEEGVTGIGEQAFSSCDAMTCLFLPNTLERLGEYAFYYCSALTEVQIPEGVTSGGQNIFCGCTALVSAVIPSSLSIIPFGLFQNCYSLEEIEIPEGVTGIGAYAFVNSGLTALSLPESLDSVGEHAFYNCENLAEVFYAGSPFGWSKVNVYTYNDSLNAAEFSFGRYFDITAQPENQRVKAGETAVFTVETEAENELSYQWYYRTSEEGEWTKVSKNGTEAVYSLMTKERHNGYQYRCAVSDGETTLYSEVATLRVNEEAEVLATGQCGDALTWTLDEDGVLTVSGTGDMWDFTEDSQPWGDYWEDIRRAVVSEGVTGIGAKGFFYCANMTEISLPDSLLTVGYGAFWSCFGLETVYIPVSVQSIGELAFLYCESLTSFTVSPDNETYCSAEGVLFTKDMRVLVAYPAGNAYSVFRVPEGVEEIGYSAFFYSTLTEVILPDSIRAIDNDAFEGCGELTRITLPEGLTSIGISAFMDCDSLTELNLPESLRDIGWWAFQSCYGLTQVYIPAGVETIGKSAFIDCTGVTEFQVSPESETFCTQDGVLFTKDMSEIMAYPLAKEGTEYSVPEGVEIIGRTAFDGASLTFISLPEGVTTVEDWAFEDSRITAVSLPASLTSIGRGAFNHCGDLADVYYGGGADGWSLIQVDENYNSALFAANVIFAQTLEIVSQPEDLSVTAGEIAEFSVEVTGAEELSYQWYVKKTADGEWSAVKAASAKTAVYRLTALMKHNGYRYCCVVTDGENTVETAVVTLTVTEPAPALEITLQPEDVRVAEGELAVFAVEATGEGELSYQWCVKKSADGAWAAVKAASAKTPVYSLTALMKHNGYQYKCIVTDSEDNVAESAVVTLTVTVNVTELEITLQPEDVRVAEGELAVFTVEAMGEGLSYQWYVKKSADGPWAAVKAASAKTPVYSLVTQLKHNGYQYKCVVTDGEEFTAETDVVTLTVTEPVPAQELQITFQTGDLSVAAGSTAVFRVEAVGEGELSYQWYVKKTADGDWAAVKADNGKTAEYSLTALARHNGYQYYCLVTDENDESVATVPVTLTVS